MLSLMLRTTIKKPLNNIFLNINNYMIQCNQPSSIALKWLCTRTVPSKKARMQAHANAETPKRLPPARERRLALALQYERNDPSLVRAWSFYSLCLLISGALGLAYYYYDKQDLFPFYSRAIIVDSLLMQDDLSSPFATENSGSKKIGLLVEVVEEWKYSNLLNAISPTLAKYLSFGEGYKLDMSKGSNKLNNIFEVITSCKKYRY